MASTSPTDGVSLGMASNNFSNQNMYGQWRERNQDPSHSTDHHEPHHPSPAEQSPVELPKQICWQAPTPALCLRTPAHHRCVRLTPIQTTSAQKASSTGRIDAEPVENGPVGFSPTAIASPSRISCAQLNGTHRFIPIISRCTCDDKEKARTCWAWWLCSWSNRLTSKYAWTIAGEKEFQECCWPCYLEMLLEGAGWKEKRQRIELLAVLYQRNAVRKDCCYPVTGAGYKGLRLTKRYRSFLVN